MQELPEKYRCLFYETIGRSEGGVFFQCRHCDTDLSKEYAHADNCLVAEFLLSVDVYPSL